MSLNLVLMYLFLKIFNSKNKSKSISMIISNPYSNSMLSNSSIFIIGNYSKLLHKLKNILHKRKYLNRMKIK